MGGSSGSLIKKIKHLMIKHNKSTYLALNHTGKEREQQDKQSAEKIGLQSSKQFIRIVDNSHFKKVIPGLSSSLWSSPEHRGGRRNFSRF
jgi:hypothetical protein